MDKAILDIIGVVAPTLKEVLSKGRMSQTEVQTWLLARLLEEQSKTNAVLSNHIQHETEVLTELCTSFRELRADMVRRGMA